MSEYLFQVPERVEGRHTSKEIFDQAVLAAEASAKGKFARVDDELLLVFPDGSTIHAFLHLLSAYVNGKYEQRDGRIELSEFVSQK